MFNSLISIITPLVFTLLCCPDPPAADSTEVNYRSEMIRFVRELRNTARQADPGFKIIAQNGERLLTENGQTDGAPNTDYLDLIDGISRESLFYGYKADGARTPREVQRYIISFLDVAQDHGKTVMAVSYCSTSGKIDDSYRLANDRNYLPFAAPDRDLTVIPNYSADLIRENSRDIRSLSDASNFLYVLNPAQFPEKHDFLSALDRTNYDILVIDWVFSKGFPLTPGEVERLKTKANGARRQVIAYLSIGEAEDYRYYWKEEWDNRPPGWMMPENPKWPGNYPVKYWKEEWKKIIYSGSGSYLSHLLTAGYDGVYLDLVDAFEYFQDLNKN